MPSVKVDLNKRNLCIYESIPNTPSADNTTFDGETNNGVTTGSIDTVYNEVNITTDLTSTVASGNYVISSSSSPPTKNGNGSFYRSFICPNTSDTVGTATRLTSPIVLGTSHTRVTSYVSYNSGSAVTVSGGTGSIGDTNTHLFTIFEVYDYIINKLDAFNNAMTYVQRCNQYTKLSYKMASNPIVLSMGKGNYSDDNTSCAMFNDTTTATTIAQPNGIRYFKDNAKVFSSSLYHNTGTYDYLKGIPAWASTVEQKPDLKTRPYIDTSKSLMQQLADLINLTKNYQAILQKYKGTTGNINYVISTDGTTQIPLDNTIPNSYNFKLTDLSDKVDKLRNQLDNRVAEILASQSSSVYQSQLLKDSSVYANVMWTILATSLIYYVFVKL